MKIIYGVNSYGSGHFTRSGVIIKHLLGRGHDVRVATGGAGIPYMDRLFPGKVTPILGLEVVVKNNRVQPIATAIKNAVVHLVFGAMNKIQSAATLFGFRPDVAISDYDGWSAQYASLFDIPLYSIDNNHVVTTCKHDPALLNADPGAHRNATLITDWIAPLADHYFVMSFFRLPITCPRTSVHAPIIRDEIARVVPRDHGHLLIYLPGETSPYEILDQVRMIERPMRVYGAKAVDTPKTFGRVTFMPFSEKTFIEDLRTAHAVIAGGGFSLMTECLALKKPMLSIPIRGQFEQTMNAHYLDAMQLGVKGEQLDTPTIQHFVERLDECRRNLAQMPPPNNYDLLSAIDRAIVAAPLIPKQIDYGRAL